MTTDRVGVSIIIPSFNGRSLLERCIPAVERAARSSLVSTEIIVVDDGGDDGTIQWLADAHPGVVAVRQDIQGGFQKAVTRGLQNSRFDLVYFLNNDVEVLPDFLQPLIDHFTDPRVFAVSSKPLSGSSGDALPDVAFRRGFWWHRYSTTREPLKHCVPTLFVSMGHGLFRRSMLDELGFLDPRFEPFYFEDQDICFRAWRQGWRCLYEPASRVDCRYQSTIGKLYSQRKIRGIHWRNRFLFQWKNLRGWRFRIREALWLPAVAAVAPFFGKGEFSIGLAAALYRQATYSGGKAVSNKEGGENVPAPEILRAFNRIPQERYRILFLLQYAIVGGAERSMELLARRLAESGYEVIFGVDGSGPLEDILLRSGFACVRLSMPPIHFFRLDRWICGAWGLARWMRENRIDLVHGQSPRTNLYAWLAGRWAGMPVVWHLRNVLQEGMWDVEKWLSNLPDAILCNSEAVRSRLSVRSQKALERIKVIYTGVDTEQFKPLASDERGRVRLELGLQESQTAIALVGRIGEKQGHEEFLRAAGEVIARRPECIFYILGGAQFPEDAVYEARARALVKDLGIGLHVKFLGHRNDVARVVGAMDFLVFPSRFEAFSRAVLEAMACGKPVVATRVGGMLEAVSDGETGRLVAPENPADLARGMLELIEDPGKRLRWGEAARLRAETLFPVTKTLNETQEVYRRLLEGFPDGSLIP